MPLALIHRASQNEDQVKFLGTRKFHGRKHLVISIRGYEHRISVFIDSKTRLISKVETLEDDPVYGDTLWQVEFSDWIEVNGIKVASHLRHKINDKMINNKIRSEF